MLKWSVRVGVFKDDRDFPAKPLGVTEVELVHDNPYGAIVLAQEVVRRTFADPALKACALNAREIKEAGA